MRSATLHPVLEALDNWAKAPEGQWYVFGSLVNAPAQFDNVLSDIDLLFVLPNSDTNAESRTARVRDLRPAVEDLEGRLMRVLRRTDASKSITSVLVATSAEIKRNVHKSAAADFFSLNTFQPLPVVLGPPTQLTTAVGEPGEVEGAVQSFRNKYLRASPNGGVFVRPYSDAESVPKDLMRMAALAKSATLRIAKSTDLDVGLGWLLELLRKRPASALRDTAEAVILRRCAGRGERLQIQPETLLFLWECLSDEYHARWLLREPGSTPQEESSEPPVQVALTHPSLLRSLADGLSRSDPTGLLTIAETYRDAAEIDAIRRPIVEAAWRGQDPIRVREWAGVFTRDRGILDVASTSRDPAITRLAAWAEWKLGNAEYALRLLDEHGAHVADPIEAARWADLSATILRFSPEGDCEAAENRYHQALSLRGVSDCLGSAMTLQNLAFLYVECGDLDFAFDFMRRAFDFGTRREYAERLTTQSVGLLGMAWIDLMRPPGEHLHRASARLIEFDELSRGGKTSAFSATRTALGRMLTWRLTGTLETPNVSFERDFWAALVYAQTAVAAGEQTSEDAANALLARFERPLLPAYRIPSLVQRPGTSPTPTEIASLQIASPVPDVWPVDTWTARTAFDAIRTMEGILAFYCAVAVARGASLSLRPQSTGGILRTLFNWAGQQSVEPFVAEVRRVTRIASDAVRARNAIVHSAPGATPEEERAVIQVARLLMEEARILRQASWQFENGRVGLEVGGATVDASGFSQITDGQQVLILNGATYRRSIGAFDLFGTTGVRSNDA